MDTDRRWLARSIFALAMCAVGALAGPAAAQQRPCQEDIKKFCPDVKPGSPEARKCLKDNLDKLSDPCRQRVSAARGRREGYPARFRGCEGDLDKLCKDVTPGAGRVIKCLRDHESELSAECKKRLSAGPGGGGGGGGGGGQGKRGGGGGGGDGKGGGGSGSATGGGQGGAAVAAPPTAPAK